MIKYVSYDQKNNVLFADYTNQTLSPEIFDQIMSEVRTLAAQLPQKLYFLACLKNTKTTPELQMVWGQYSVQMLQYVKGIVRYEATDTATNIAIRSGTVRYHVQGINSHIYPSREAALAAIRQMEQMEQNEKA
jgi:hypothetical protein